MVIFSIFLLIVAGITAIQLYQNYHIWKGLASGEWENNDFKRNCIILSRTTDQDNAAHLYLVMIGYEIMVLVLSIIIACDFPNNASTFEFELGLCLILSRVTIFTPIIYQSWLTYYKRSHDKKD